MAVKFLKPCQQGALYNEGEIASFDEATEKMLVDQKFAEPVKPKPDPKPAA
jgi:hypothetical protein